MVSYHLSAEICKATGCDNCDNGVVAYQDPYNYHEKRNEFRCKQPAIRCTGVGNAALIACAKKHIKVPEYFRQDNIVVVGINPTHPAKQLELTYCATQIGICTARNMHFVVVNKTFMGNDTCHYDKAQIPQNIYFEKSFAGGEKILKMLENNLIEKNTRNLGIIIDLEHLWIVQNYLMFLSKSTEQGMSFDYNWMKNTLNTTCGPETGLKNSLMCQKMSVRLRHLCVNKKLSRKEQESIDKLMACHQNDMVTNPDDKNEMYQNFVDANCLVGDSGQRKVRDDQEYIRQCFFPVVDGPQVGWFDWIWNPNSWCLTIVGFKTLQTFIIFVRKQQLVLAAFTFIAMLWGLCQKVFQNRSPWDLWWTVGWIKILVCGSWFGILKCAKMILSILASFFEEDAQNAGYPNQETVREVLEMRVLKKNVEDLVSELTNKFNQQANESNGSGVNILQNLRQELNGNNTPQTNRARSNTLIFGQQ
jgi:hypothetical protein